LPPPPGTEGGMDHEVEGFASKWKVNEKSGKREMVALRHPAMLSVTPCVEGEAPVVLNAHDAEWL
jgi:hypothetical protein